VVAVEERLAHVEGRIEGQAQMLTDVGARLVALDQKFDLKFAALEAKVDRKFSELEAKVDRRITELEAKFGRKFDALEAKISSNFRWMVGIQFTILVALLASFIAG
jgi:uncharacterized coiled-coil protein SlyX